MFLVPNINKLPRIKGASVGLVDGVANTTAGGGCVEVVLVLGGGRGSGTKEERPEWKI